MIEVYSFRDGFAYCQLPACNLESEDQLFQFLRQKLRKGGAEIGSGDGGNRLATLLHVLRPGDTDVLKEVVEEADLDSVEAGVLEDLLDGKDVDEDDQKDLVEKLEDELECGEVPEGAEACTRRVPGHLLIWKMVEVLI